ncbi:MAG TPA: hypothetical protein VJ754_08030 [Anaerolineae bacterium]|nr:hypothetical protein [Anaerolineae bacterium]
MPDILSTLSGLPSTSVLIALIMASSLMVILSDWRVLVLILGIQYLLVGMFLIVSRIEGFPIELAIVKALVGIMIVPALYISARRARWGRPVEADEADDIDGARPRLAWLRSPGLALRTIAALLVAAVALSLALRNPIEITASQTSSRYVTIAMFMLVAQGLLNIGLNENPLKAGLGLLTALAGFEAFYAVVEPTLLIIALLGLLNLVIALALALLITAWAVRPHETSQ